LCLSLVDPPEIILERWAIGITLKGDAGHKSDLWEITVDLLRWRCNKTLQFRAGGSGMI